MTFTKRQKAVGIITLALGVVTLSVFVSVAKLNSTNDIPLPFGFNTSSSPLTGAISEIGKKSGISVKKVTFPTGTDSETLIEDSLYLVVVPDDQTIDEATLDDALTVAGVHSVNYFGYKYSSATAGAEKANKTAPVLTERFPGQFFASAKARAEDAQNGGSIAAFESTNGITMAATDTATGAQLSRNSLYFFIVNEASGALLTVRQPAVCGDGEKEGTEVCDDGDTDSGDGCSATCTVESGFSCTGSTPSVCTEDPLLTLTTLSLPAERSSHTGTIVPLVRFTVTTGVKAVAMENLVFTGVNGVPPTGGSDAVYMLAAGNSEGDYNIRDVDLCLGGPDEILCENVPHLLPGAFPPHSTHHFQLYGMFGAAQTGVSLQLDASANTALAYAMTDDGENSIPLRNMSKNGVCQTAPCEISLTTIPSTNWTIGGEQVSAVCGDTIIDVNNDAEECDDGNLIDSDFCSNQCTFPVPPATCGNGNVEVGETCDDADESSGDGCSSTCAVESGYSCIGEPSVCTQDPVCGDGVKEGSEACDDNNTTAADGCSATCQIEQGYFCSGSGQNSCQLACGDSNIQTEGADGILGNADDETCDDGDFQSGDGCSSTCKIEQGYFCSGTGQNSCSLACGDSNIQTEGADGIFGNADDEECDDGDFQSGDGCSSTCKIEQGYFCSGSGQNSCQLACGDSNIQTEGADGIFGNADDETCDDGDFQSGDGCSSTCTVESGFSCTGQPSICTPI